MCFLFVVLVAEQVAFIGHPTQLLCGKAKGDTTDWMYQSPEHSQRRRISGNGTVSSHHNGRYATNGSSLVINEVKASDAGFYICGHGRQVYHKLRLCVSGM